MKAKRRGGAEETIDPLCWPPLPLFYRTSQAAVLNNVCNSILLCGVSYDVRFRKCVLYHVDIIRAYEHLSAGP
jgi:hypothetical protein